ncbi:MAG: cupin domain-containing protein [Verrucomicrobia bacterium]|nr:cupin domain-containing protein [Verrucomicrobiota bacterium]
MASQYFFSLKTIGPRIKNEAGHLTDVTSKDVPGFVNISFANLTLKKKGILKPIWHPNAHKIGYCIQGKCVVTLRSPDKNEVFSVEKGEIFFIPQGFVHSIQNCGEIDCIINFALNDTLPETMSFTKAVYSLSDPVFKATFAASSGFVDGLKKSKNEELIATLAQVTKGSGSGGNPYKFNIEKSDKVVSTRGGYLQLGIKKSLPSLQGLGILGFGLNAGGVVEPHWHTNAGELVYIVKGKTRITILAPSGNVEVLEVSGGEGAFAPASHFHNIENIGQGDVEVIAFFSNAEPDYIGIGEVTGAYSNDELGSIFNVEPKYFDALKKPQGPLVIVPL